VKKEKTSNGYYIVGNTSVLMYVPGCLVVIEDEVENFIEMSCDKISLGYAQKQCKKLMGQNGGTVSEGLLSVVEINKQDILEFKKCLKENGESSVFGLGLSIFLNNRIQFPPIGELRKEEVYE